MPKIINYPTQRKPFSKHKNKVCPKCGVTLSARGMASHIAHKHPELLLANKAILPTGNRAIENRPTIRFKTDNKETGSDSRTSPVLKQEKEFSRPMAKEHGEVTVANGLSENCPDCNELVIGRSYSDGKYWHCKGCDCEWAN